MKPSTLLCLSALSAGAISHLILARDDLPTTGTWISHHNDGNCTDSPLTDKSHKPKIMDGDCTNWEPRGTGMGINYAEDPNNPLHGFKFFSEPNCQGDLLGTPWGVGGPEGAAPGRRARKGTPPPPPPPPPKVEGTFRGFCAGKAAVDGFPKPIKSVHALSVEETLHKEGLKNMLCNATVCYSIDHDH
ncbi:uncharacterized protein KY384_007426 [Bacidia gigantensis]|uniref:uncharacterized protein n=1 Tax=Bacidia gigantensis TaxID=2732470 RepID=UPI001D050B46|nr:uncharacterized protein KY384_007426 [Bacidia gigantensis]KAG8528508.1 hypothetical protein KY384_007426 [Bacidia gigantensis]